MINFIILLCPNCHTQTKTYGSKRLKKDRKCKNCENDVSQGNKTGYCGQCFNKIYYNKIIM